MHRFIRSLRWIILSFFICVCIAALVFFQIVTYYSARLPNIQSLKQIDWQEPMYVYASDGQLMAIYGETRRYPVKISQVPLLLKEAFLASEDARFYEHGGLDYRGIARAIWLLATTNGQRVPGGSTITQQVAREFFLNSDYSFKRKFSEMLLARKIESELTKDEIFEIYLNKTFFGNRAHGIGAAAEFYYGKTLNQLTLDEMASLAGIPKFPSSANPISNPERARQRRDNYVLQRMLELGFITPSQEEAARNTPMHASPHEPKTPAYSAYACEMVRQEMIARYGADVLDKGYRVYTTINPKLQSDAEAAVISGLKIYDHRHGWLGPEKHLILTDDANDSTIAAYLKHTFPQAGLIPVVVAHLLPDGGATVVTKEGEEISLSKDAALWTKKSLHHLLRRGDLIRISRTTSKDGENLQSVSTWSVDQLPRAQAALISLNVNDGAIKAIVGGYSYAGNKFNRVTQAHRQPGSTFKPFIYSAAFDKGFLPSSLMLDAPVVYQQKNRQDWSPQNDDGQFLGPITLHDALVQSRNLVSVRLLDAIGIPYALQFVTRFGFDQTELPPNLSLALGTASLTPLSLARGYAIFANGGSRVDTWFIKRVEDRNKNVIFQETPLTACQSCGLPTTAKAHPSTSTENPEMVDGFNFGDTIIPATPSVHPATEDATDTTPTDKTTTPQLDSQLAKLETKAAPRVLDPRVAFQIMSILRDVVLHGTGTQARVIGRADIAGKTGSTNDFRDAWFSGFGGPYVTTVWVGRDDFQTLGNHEYGGKAALPIWTEFMMSALKNKPIAPLIPPPQMTQVTVNGITEWIKNEDIDHLQDHDQAQSPDKQEEEKSFDIF